MSINLIFSRKCEFDGKDAKFVDVTPILGHNKAKFMCYCKAHAKIGIAFGFIERIEIEEITNQTESRLKEVLRERWRSKKNLLQH